jgi:hypothetical protein
VAAAVGEAESSPAPSGDIPALPECLDGMPVVMLAHERDGPGAGYTIEDGQAGKGGASTPSAASAGDLYSFNRCALPGFGQRGQDVGPIGGQLKIWPAKPSRFPADVRRWLAKQVHTEGWDGTIGKRAAEATASQQPARGQPQDPWCRGIPEFAHGTMVLIPSRPIAGRLDLPTGNPVLRSVACATTGYGSFSSVA